MLNQVWLHMHDVGCTALLQSVIYTEAVIVAA